MHLKCQRDFVLVQFIPPNRRGHVRKEENLYSNAAVIKASLMKLLWEIWSDTLMILLYLLIFFKAVQLKSNLLTIKILNILYSQPICHCLRVLGGVKVCGEVWGLGRVPDPIPTGYRVSPLCPCAGAAWRAVLGCTGYLETENSCGYA